ARRCSSRSCAAAGSISRSCAARSSAPRTWGSPCRATCSASSHWRASTPPASSRSSAPAPSTSSLRRSRRRPTARSGWSPRPQRLTACSFTRCRVRWMGSPLRERPAPRERLSAAERAEQLIDVAEALFIAKGYDRTSVGDIAAAAGVSRPVVYEYHGSKEGVYVAALQRAKHRLVDDSAEALAGLRDPREILRAAADVWFSFVERDPDRWVLLYGGSAVPLTGELGERLAAVNA